MKSTFALIIGVIILTGCSPYHGNSPKATEMRSRAINELMATYAPDGCTYNREYKKYVCDTNHDLINTRIETVQKKMEENFRNRSVDGAFDSATEIAVFELYGCKDAGEIMYCETVLPNRFCNDIKKQPEKVEGLHVYVMKR